MKTREKKRIARKNLNVFERVVKTPIYLSECWLNRKKFKALKHNRKTTCQQKQ